MYDSQTGGRISEQLTIIIYVVSRYVMSSGKGSSDEALRSLESRTFQIKSLLFGL